MTTWKEHNKARFFPSLQENISVDVAIIGGGITGLLTAYRLSRAGKTVAILEKKEIGSYATIMTTAFITKVVDTNIHELASIFSDKTARLVFESGQTAIEEFDKLIKEEEIDCEFVRCSNHVMAVSPKQLKDLVKDLDLYEKWKLGAVFHEDGDGIGIPNYGYLEVKNQAKFHPTKFLYELAEKLDKEGVKFFENTEALNIVEGKSIIIETKGGKIFAKDIVIATYKPFSNERTHLKKAMYRSYVFEVEIPKGLFKEGIYEDLSNPYYYFRIDKGEEHDRMIVGGDDHKDIFGDNLVNKSFRGLEDYLEHVMGDAEHKIVNKWYGPILEPSDGLPLIGKIKPHYYVATAFSGNGMTYSMISSMLIADLISDKKNSWTKVYDPKRSILRPKRLASKAKDYVEEFIGGALKNILS